MTPRPRLLSCMLLAVVTAASPMAALFPAALAAKTSPALAQAGQMPAVAPVKHAPAQKPPAKAPAVRGQKAPSQAEAPPAAASTPAWDGLPEETRTQLQQATAALQDAHRQVNNELRDEETTSTEDLNQLWRAAVERSGTIRYAIEKLSRRDATGKPVSNDTLTRRMLQSLAHVGGVAGAIWTGSPASMIGGSMVNQVLAADPSQGLQGKISDTDMLLLTKEVEALQAQLLDAYTVYMHRRQQHQLAQQSLTTLRQEYERVSAHADPTTQAVRPILESMLDAARHDAQDTEQAMLSARTSLGLLVGPEAMVAFQVQHDR